MKHRKESVSNSLGLLSPFYKRRTTFEDDVYKGT